MDTKELATIARTFTDAIMEQGLTRAELGMFMGVLDAMVKDRAINTPTEVAPKAKRPPAPAPVKKDRSIKYDPVYDPAPPMTGDDIPPPPDITTGQVIAPRGAACICEACTKVVYTVNKDIPDNCKVSDFIASYTPFEGSPTMQDKIEIQNVDGNISIDCPACGAQKALYLVGKKVGV